MQVWELKEWLEAVPDHYSVTVTYYTSGQVHKDSIMGRLEIQKNYATLNVNVEDN